MEWGNGNLFAKYHMHKKKNAVNKEPMTALTPVYWFDLFLHGVCFTDYDKATDLSTGME